MKMTEGLASVSDPLDFRNNLALTALLTVTNRMRWPPRLCLTLPAWLRSLIDPSPFAVRRVLLPIPALVTSTLPSPLVV